jgi:plastocyanin
MEKKGSQLTIRQNNSDNGDTMNLVDLEGDSSSPAEAGKATSSNFFSDLNRFGLYILGFFILVLQLIIIFGLMKYNSSTYDSVNYLNAEVSDLQKDMLLHHGIYDAYTVNGSITASIQASAIKVSEPSTYLISETVIKQKRVWSAPLMKIYVDDTILWRWETNENIVSSDGDYVPWSGHRVLDSGPLKSKSEFSYTFLKPGNYFYTSENTPVIKWCRNCFRKNCHCFTRCGSWPSVLFRR